MVVRKTYFEPKEPFPVSSGTSDALWIFQQSDRVQAAVLWLTGLCQND